MIGPKKLSEIRAELRAGFDMTDKELLAWFNREIQALERQKPPGRTGRETMRSLRDALLAPAKKRRARSGKKKGEKKVSRTVAKAP
jgi:hypothetical protein